MIPIFDHEEIQDARINSMDQDEHDCPKCGEHFSVCVCEEPETVEDNATNETGDTVFCERCKLNVWKTRVYHHRNWCNPDLGLSHDKQSATADPKPENRDHVEQHRAEEDYSAYLDSIQHDAHDDFFEGGREELKRFEE